MDRGLIPCPYCSHEVIPGSDECDECGQPLTDQHLPVPATLVERQLLSDRITACAPRPPICVTSSIPIREVLRMLVDNRVGCVLVMEQGKLAGIFTERDVLRKIGENAKEWGDRPVSEFMTRGVQTLKANTKIAFAFHRMDLGGFRHVPIVDDAGHPIGVISVRDLLKYLTGHLRTARKSLD